MSPPFSGSIAQSAPPPVATKLCPKCKGEPQPISNFSKCASRKDGLSCYCKACVKCYSDGWYQRNREQKYAKHKAWRENNRDKENGYTRAWRKRNPDKQYLACKRWIENNRERVRAIDRKRNLSESRKAWARAWRDNNADRIREQDRARHERDKEKRNAWKRTYARQNLAISFGKSSPIHKRTGFALVSDGRDKWRAARIGILFGQHERAQAYYEYEPVYGIWIVSPPSVGTFDANLIRRLQERERMQRRQAERMAA